MDPELSAVAAAARERLAAAGVEDPRVEAELLLAWALGQPRGVVLARLVAGATIGPEDAARFGAALERRVRREPLQHITGLAPFRSLELEVGPGVFVPRPETELLAGIAVDFLRASGRERPVAVDLGTGSGAIALSMATEVPHARVVAIERSPEALAWASRNVRRLGAEVDLREGDLADAAPELDGRVSVVASNPPYIPDDAVPRTPEVRLHDPAEALFGGPDGLDPMRAVAATGRRLLHAGGALVVEHGEHQGAQVRALLTEAGLRGARTHVDLTGRDRVTTATR